MQRLHHPPRWRGLFTLWLFAWAGLLLLGHPAGAATFTVTSTTDSGPGSLRAAIVASEASTDADDTINITATGTISLTQGELEIYNDLNTANKTLTITGPGASSLAVSGNGQSEVFDIYDNDAGDITVTISGLTITAGYDSGDGGGLYNEETLNLTDCDISQNNSEYGGGIYNDGALIATNCSVNDNVAEYGGGIYSDDTMTLIGCTVDNNVSYDDSGGGIYNVGFSLMLTKCTISNNSSEEGYDGGGIYSDYGTLDLTDCLVTGNNAEYGGGIYSDGGAATLTRCTVSNNVADYDEGGGIYNDGTSLTLTDCVISDNAANDDDGGGIYSSGSTLTLSGCTVSHNIAYSGYDGGGIYSDGDTLTLTNCTLSGNAAVDGNGGGLYIYQDNSNNNQADLAPRVSAITPRFSAITTTPTAEPGTALLINCTITGNAATGGNGGGLFFSGNNGSGAFALCIVRGCLIAGNIGTGNVMRGKAAAQSRVDIVNSSTEPDVSTGNSTNTAPFTSGGSNIIGIDDTEGSDGFYNDPDHANPNSTGNHDQVGTPEAPIAPKLGPLQDNGGPTPTHALQVGSPALDADFGPDLRIFQVGISVPVEALQDQVIKVDQRGLTRPVGDRNDVGAYEHQPPTAPDDAYTAEKNNPLNIPAPGVLGNDSADPGSSPDTLGTVLITNPTHGTVTLNTDGSFTYAAFTGYTGPDSFAYNAFDAYGLRSGLATVTLNVTDNKAPYTTATVNGTAGNNGFYRSAVTVTLTATDPEDAPGQVTTRYTADGSIPTTYTGPIPFAGDGPHTLKFFSMDSTGNAETPQTLVVKIDTQIPTITGNFTPAANAAGWNNTPVDYTYTAADNYSGVASATPGSPIHTTTEGDVIIQIAVADNAGNSGTVTRAGPRIDLTAPVTSVNTQSVASGQQVTLSATDSLSGIAYTTYSVDGGAQTTYAGPFTVTGNGAHTVTFSSTDKAGNVETTRSLQFNSNSTAPHTTAALSGQQNPDGSFVGTVTVTLSATSATSTVASTHYSVDGGAQTTYAGPFTVTGNGAHTVTFSSTDAAGNTEAANTVSFLIGLLTPSVLHTYPAGLQMFSAPEDYSNVPLSQTLGTPNPKLAVWVPGLLQYALTPNAPADALHSGQGYWARFPQATPLYDTGTPTRTDQAFGIPLQRGWNMIGDPFTASVPLSAVRIQDGSSNTFTLGESNAAGLVFPTLFTYSAGSTQYQSLDASGGSLAPYQGYWIYALQACTLSVPPPAP